MAAGRAVGHRHDSRPGFNQAPREKTALSEAIATIAIAHRGRLACEIEGGLPLPAGDEIDGPLLKLIHAARARLARQRRLIELLEHAAPLPESFERNALLLFEGVEAKR